MSVAQRQANSHGRFLELSEYGGEGRRSFIIISEGDGSGWGNCVSPMRNVVKYFEQKGAVRSRNGEAFGANPAMPRSVEQGRQSYVDVLLGKRHIQEIENMSRRIMGNSGMQTLKGVEGFGRKEARTLLGNQTVQAGDNNSKTITAVLEGVSDFQTLRNILISLK